MAPLPLTAAAALTPLSGEIGTDDPATHALSASLAGRAANHATDLLAVALGVNPF